MCIFNCPNQFNIIEIKTQWNLRTNLESLNLKLKKQRKTFLLPICQMAKHLKNLRPIWIIKNRLAVHEGNSTYENNTELMCINTLKLMFLFLILTSYHLNRYRVQCFFVVKGNKIHFVLEWSLRHNWIWILLWTGEI